jgi:hypothetical protein
MITIIIRTGGSEMRTRTFFVSEVARRLGVPPQVISNLFYRRLLDDTLCPVVSGRRLIPSQYVRQIARRLRERRLIPNRGENPSNG